MTPSDQSYREIPLTRGQVTIVDAEDFEWLSQWKWCAQWESHTRSFYAVRSAYIGNRKSRSMVMHRVILGLEHGDKRQGDHRNHDTLDNRKGNLRKVTHAQNMANKRKGRDNTSGFKGVCKQDTKWVASITIDGSNISIGRFKTPVEAYAAYCITAAIVRGEFACLG